MIRQESSLIASLEGMSRIAFRLVRELAQNSRTGLTVRFLSRKIEIPEDEVEYIVDTYDRLLFFDLTRVRLVNEGYKVIARICNGLENHGDVPSLFRSIKKLGTHEVQLLEEKFGLRSPSSRNAVTEAILERCYKYPDSIVNYVAQRDFTPQARTIFDIVWQSEHGILSISELREKSGLKEYEVEKALAELIQNFVLFELFRFDPEDRLVRFISILSELSRDRQANSYTNISRIAPIRSKKHLLTVVSKGLEFSEKMSQLIAAIAARPVRIRSNGELYKEDYKYLEEICSENDEPSLSTYLWVAEGINWLARVDNELHVVAMPSLTELSQLERHRLLFEWLSTLPHVRDTRKSLVTFIENFPTNFWYRTADFITWATHLITKESTPVLRNVGGHWAYSNPHMSVGFEKNLVRALDEVMFWLGVIERGEFEGDSVFRVTSLGRYLLKGVLSPQVKKLVKYKKTEIVVQPNFEVLVPLKDIDPLFMVPLAQFATRVSLGNVAIYHLTKEAFMRALQSGLDGNVFIKFLLQNCKNGVIPQNVLTTLEDWRGGAKRVRLRVLYVIEADESLVLADLSNRRRIKKYLIPIDGTNVVSYANISKRQLIRELEKEGFVVE